MRKRKEIEEEWGKLAPVQKDFHDTKIRTELLLDIRDLLIHINRRALG